MIKSPIRPISKFLNIIHRCNRCHPGVPIKSGRRISGLRGGNSKLTTKLSSWSPDKIGTKDLRVGFINHKSIIGCRSASLETDNEVVILRPGWLAEGSRAGTSISPLLSVSFWNFVACTHKLKLETDNEVVILRPGWLAEGSGAGDLEIFRNSYLIFYI